MLGHFLPNEIFEYAYVHKRAFISQQKGKPILSTTREENNVGFVIHKKDDEIYVIDENERNEMQILNIPLVTVGSCKDISETFIPDRFFENLGLLNRPFIHGIFDCYTLIKDYYRKNFNLFLPTNIQRTWEWWLNGENLYVDNAKNYDFVEVTEIKPHDLIIMKLGSQMPNHGAIYTGKNKILHHVSGRFSTEEELTSFYKHNIAIVYRNKNI